VTYRYVNRGGDMSQLLTESSDFFALDATSGQLLWRYTPRDSIRHNAIAIGGGKVCLIDRPLAMFDRVKRPKEKDHPPGRLIALDARTGATQWTVDDDVYGTMLALSVDHKVLLMSYQPTRFQLDSEVGGRMAAYDLGTGKQRWNITAKYRSRPLLNGRTIYAEGGAWDLLSGAPRPFRFDRSYGCGILAGCRNMLLFRSATLGYRDLSADGTTRNYGGMRPGCWVNTLPAGGLVLVPDASAGCRCSYLNRAWIALEPVTRGG
jgi:outer membrane protein assembly factor BamB